MRSKFQFLAISTCLIIVSISVYIRVGQMAHNSFAFTMDQARDMIDIRSIVIGKHPLLIGPTTSINGVFLGPAYYYYNLLPFILGKGDPNWLMYWNIFGYAATALVMCWYFARQRPILGFITGTVFIMAPGYYVMTHLFWNANVMPIATTLYFLCSISLLTKPSMKKALLTGFIAGIAMQMEAALGILLFPFILLMFLIKYRTFKPIMGLIGGFLITLLPQALFELRHSFIMTKTFLGELTAKSGILGEKLSFEQSYSHHLKSYMDTIEGIFILPPHGSLIFLLIATVGLAILWRLGQVSRISKISASLALGFLLFSFIFYLFYPHELKDWYLHGLKVPVILVISTFLAEIFSFSWRNRYSMLIIKAGILVLLVYFFSKSVLDQLPYIRSIDYVSKNKSALANELEAINWVYAHTNERGFKAYNYIPSIYDFPYQYLYWWYGPKQYGYQPENITYLDNVPSYIANNQSYLTQAKPQQDNLIALIYEAPENKQFLQAWLGNFSRYCTIHQETFAWGTTVEIRQPCATE